MKEPDNKCECGNELCEHEELAQGECYECLESEEGMVHLQDDTGDWILYNDDHDLYDESDYLNFDYDHYAV